MKPSLPKSRDVLSHPLYLSYFVFFLPYFLKVLSFLSPLFITISLLLLGLLTLSSTPHDVVLGKFLKSRAEGNDGNNGEVSSVEDGYGSVELEAYNIVFEISSPEVVRVDQEEDDDEVIKGIVAEQVVLLKEAETVGDCSIVHEANSDMGSDGIVIQQGEFFSKCSSVIYEDSSDAALPENYMDEIANQPEVIKHVTEEKITEEQLKKKEEKEANFSKISSLQNTNEGNKCENFAQNCLDDQNNNYNNLGSYGSMRKEKEWKRTLACKLFEERHNNEGSAEGMDLLWETYETADDNEKVKESPLSKSKEKKKQNEKTKTKTKRGSILDQWLEEEDEEEEEETDSSQLCCLQALKLSSGKMNLGLGKPNLVKMSKALKGIGWLHHVTAKNARKNYKLI